MLPFVLARPGVANGIVIAQVMLELTRPFIPSIDMSLCSRRPTHPRLSTPPSSAPAASTPWSTPPYRTWSVPSVRPGAYAYIPPLLSSRPWLNRSFLIIQEDRVEILDGLRRRMPCWGPDLDPRCVPFAQPVCQLVGHLGKLPSLDQVACCWLC